MPLSPIYEKWRNVSNKLHSGELDAKQGATQLIELLVENGTKLRPKNHTLLGLSYFNTDRDDYMANKEKPLAVGFIYRKPNGIKTRDICIVRPDGDTKVYYSEKDLIKEYPRLRGVHKKDLPI